MKAKMKEKIESDKWAIISNQHRGQSARNENQWRKSNHESENQLNGESRGMAKISASKAWRHETDGRVSGEMSAKWRNEMKIWQ
jgi:hypothetical protein